jgi:hypothetical protein
MAEPFPVAEMSTVPPADVNFVVGLSNVTLLGTTDRAVDEVTLLIGG